MRELCHGATVPGQFAYISLSEKCCKCVIIHNISVNLCILMILTVRINNVPKVNIVYSCSRPLHTQSEYCKKMRWARILLRHVPLK